jgi:antirestriction protein ArdC
MLRQFRVFNAEQADGLPARFYPDRPDVAPLGTPQAVLDAYLASGEAASMAHDVHGQAYYSPSADAIHLPPIDEHRTADDYYSTAFHEIAHSTGHASRLGRVGVTEATATFGSHAYGKEELIAQMGASMLLAETGIDGDAVYTNSAAYLASWLEAIREDKKLIISSASAGQKAADLVMTPYRQAIANAEAMAEAVAA